MRACALACAVAMVAVPAPAWATGLVIDLLPGHAVSHEREREAGVVMAISITPDQRDPADLRALCEELRLAAGLGRASGEAVPLEVVFVVPYKGMAIEGYYLPAAGGAGSEALVRGNGIARRTLEGIIGRAGIPTGVLDETEVEHEISCELGEPAWLIRWEDVRPVDGEAPDAVIERAYRRFMAIHLSVVEHAARLSVVEDAAGSPASAHRRALASYRQAGRLVGTHRAPAPGAAPQGSQLQP